MSGYGKWGSLLASIKITGFDDLEIAISKLGNETVEIAKKVVYAGAQPVADEIRKGLQKNLEGSKLSEGDLENSLGISPPGVDKNGNTNIKIGFAGLDRKGVPNVVKARAMESGTSVQDKKPFVRLGVNRSRDKSIKAMQDKYDEETEKIMK